MTKRTVTIDPVSDAYGSAVLPLEAPGRWATSTCAPTSAPPTRSCAKPSRVPQPAAIDWFIVDLRYKAAAW